VPKYLQPYTALYCGLCHRYLQSVEWRGEVLVWIEACDWCAEHDRERRAEVDKLEAL
jgi:hypothetical protein